MSVTTGLSATRINCDHCPATIDDTGEGAVFLHGWKFCRVSGFWSCPCCEAQS